MENFVVNLKVIIGRKERTFAVQKATSFGKITKIYHICKGKNYNLLVVLLLTCKLLGFHTLLI